MKISVRKISLSSVIFLWPLIVLLQPTSSNAQRAPGPDIIVGRMAGLDAFGINGTPPTQFGMSVGTTVCNNGDVEVNFIEMPNTNHPVVAHNVYRMSGGPGNDERFEQIGQSWVKHTFGAKSVNSCSFGCADPATYTLLGVGCSDTYLANQNALQSDLGSRAWINPFTGVFPPTARDHTGHNHTGTSHRILVDLSDLDSTMNPGARYFAEVQYITPDEYSWCQSHPGQCNMYNNASYEEYHIEGTTEFTFTPVGETVRTSPAINAWPGATINPIEPAPGSDGRAYLACKVTALNAGVWHYEYALYNQNLDRGVQSFRVPLGGLITVSNVGFHAPQNHPGFANDGTLGDAGYSNAAWTSNQTAGDLSWTTQTFAQNQNANAIRWGTAYTFRFDSNRPPQAATATIGFFKTGKPITVATLTPDSTNASPTPVPTVTPGPTATPGGTPVPTATPTLTPPATPQPSVTPGGSSRAINLSTRMRVGTGDDVGIGGFILTSDFSSSVVIIVRALGPSMASYGVPNVLIDPVLELHGPDGQFDTAINDNWADEPINLQSGFAPPHPLESMLYRQLRHGAYTAIVRGKNNTSGVALVEIYDAGGGNVVTLSNISTRARVSTGDDIVIAGFILGIYPGPNRLVVRGLGPSLPGLVNALADPKLELRDNNGALLAANDNWVDDPALAADLTALHLAPIHPLEAAISVALPPGVYTALLSGTNNGTGIGLVEVYCSLPSP